MCRGSELALGEGLRRATLILPAAGSHTQKKHTRAASHFHPKCYDDRCSTRADLGAQRRASRQCVIHQTETCTHVRTSAVGYVSAKTPRPSGPNKHFLLLVKFPQTVSEFFIGFLQHTLKRINTHKHTQAGARKVFREGTEDWLARVAQGCCHK